MNERDVFAMHVRAGLGAGPACLLAAEAYEAADAMILARGPARDEPIDDDEIRATVEKFDITRISDTEAATLWIRGLLTDVANEAERRCSARYAHQRQIILEADRKAIEAEAVARATPADVPALRVEADAQRDRAIRAESMLGAIREMLQRGELAPTQKPLESGGLTGGEVEAFFAQAFPSPIPEAKARMDRIAAILGSLDPEGDASETTQGISEAWKIAKKPL
jgi:hypothetical protein